MEGLPIGEECICLPDPGEITEPRGEYDAGLQIEAEQRQQQKQQGQQRTMAMGGMAAMPVLPQRPAVVCEQDAAHDVDPTAQPVRTQFSLTQNGTRVIRVNAVINLLTKAPSPRLRL